MSKSPKPPVPLYSALADATRCRILTILQAGPVPVHKLADSFPISRPAISRHLRVLKSAGLVAEVKKGRENLYTFKPAKLERARAWIDLMTVAPIVEARAAETAPAKPKSGKKPTTPAKAKAAPEAAKPVAADPVIPASQMGFDF
jgi:DNA-binding transcriptional ArsR family regulator